MVHWTPPFEFGTFQALKRCTCFVFMMSLSRVSLYMQLETGRITEPQFEIEEKLLLDRLDAIESRLEDEEEIGGPDVTTADDKHDHS